MTRNKTLAILVTAPLLAGLAACGGDGGTDVANGPVGTSGEAQKDDAAGEAAATEPAEDAPAASGKGTVTMTDNEFSPTTVSVKPGQSVSIVNSGAIVHNLVDRKNQIDSGDVEPDAKGTVKAPEKAGSYRFVCTYHAGMEGTFKVA
ncbi:MAG: cupredoxin domain-containing protein [Sporichthyaceae bacterium]